MELHTEEGIVPGVPEAELTIQGKRRCVKKGSGSYAEDVRSDVCLCSGRVRTFTTTWLCLNGES
jgi:hypothetical protein